MKVLIELKDSTYEAIKNEYCILPPQKGLLKILWDAIQNGVVFPSNHGRLVDVKEVNKQARKRFPNMNYDDSMARGAIATVLKNTPTVLKEE
jgi:hypothetical protein